MCLHGTHNSKCRLHLLRQEGRKGRRSESDSDLTSTTIRAPTADSSLDSDAWTDDPDFLPDSFFKNRQKADVSNTPSPVGFPSPDRTSISEAWTGDSIYYPGPQCMPNTDGAYINSPLNSPLNNPLNSPLNSAWSNPWDNSPDGWSVIITPAAGPLLPIQEEECPETSPGSSKRLTTPPSSSTPSSPMATRTISDHRRPQQNPGSPVNRATANTRHKGGDKKSKRVIVRSKTQ
ncbi:hypothetical protein QBC43DRAFT_313559 [Cladorrhinum sp. PSN259]|nr:hypothetical protein QBC43DRAFT_313559 [Cladorrhinum sp. PSN259]